MTTKIDISSLDEYTKNRIEKLSKRCSELYIGIDVVVNLPITLTYTWTEGETGGVGEWGNYPKYEIDWDFVQKHEQELQQKMDKEVKDIIDFSNSVADRLGVDRDKFFDQYFA